MIPIRRFGNAVLNALDRRRIRVRTRRVSVDAIRRRGNRTVALIVGSALFMEQLDGTILTTALPEMARSFDALPTNMNVALTSYLLALAVFIPVSGKIADRFGARTVFCSAIALFTVGSVLCGVSGSLPALVASRVLQGIGGAMMLPVGRLVLLRSVSKAELVSAMTWLMVPAQIGPIVGPPLGGFIVTYLSWRWIFFINVPIGLLGVVLAWRRIGNTREPGRIDFDLLGLILSGLSLACLVFGLETLSRGESSTGLASGAILAGLASGMLYVRHARTHPQPILDFSLMALPTFSVSVIGGGLSRIAAAAIPFLLALMLQVGFGWTAAASGLVTFASSAGSLLMRFAAQPILRRWGYRNVMIWNGIVASAFLAATAALRPGWPVAAIYALLLTGGFFQSLQFIAYNTIAYSDIPAPRMSAATSFYATFQQLNLTLGICVAAGSLAASSALWGHPYPMVPDYSMAFLLVTGISLLAGPICMRLPGSAGQQLIGARHPNE